MLILLSYAQVIKVEVGKMNYTVLSQLLMFKIRWWDPA
jgi:hypothetical protein